MFILLIRTIILYLVVVICIRIMGKRQLGQLQPYELVIAIMISDLASLPMGDTRIPLIHGIIPIVTLLILQTTFSLLELKNDSFRTILNGKPNILIKSGKVQIPVLKSQLFSINDLMEELRIQGYFDIKDIEYAVLETNGEISVITKSDLDTVTRKDLNINAIQEKLPVILIMEGKIIHSNLKLIEKDEAWVKNLLKKNKLTNIKNIFIAYLDTEGNFSYQLKTNSKEEKGEIDL